MNRKCTDAKPCNMTTCYGCARKLIDDLAGHMLDQGASESAVNDGFRYPAINALAFHIPAPSPKTPAKPKARKAFTPKAGVNYQGIADALRGAGSRDAGQALLAGATVVELDHIWSLTGRTDRIPAKLVKADRLAHMVEALVGYRLDSEAIRTGAMSH